MRWWVSLCLAGPLAMAFVQGGLVGLGAGLFWLLVGSLLWLWIVGAKDRRLLRALLRSWLLHLLALHSRTARRTLGGHWEHGGAWFWDWYHVDVCSHQHSYWAFCDRPCVHVRCEHWDWHPGPDDNIVGPDDPHLALRVQIEEQAQKIEALAQEQQRLWEARQVVATWGSRTHLHQQTRLNNRLLMDAEERLKTYVDLMQRKGGLF